MPFVLVHVIDLEGAVIRVHGPPDVLEKLCATVGAEPHPEHTDAVSVDGTSSSVRVVLNQLESMGWKLNNTVGSTIQTYVFAHAGGATIVESTRAPGEEEQ